MDKNLEDVNIGESINKVTKNMAHLSIQKSQVAKNIIMSIAQVKVF